MRGVLDASASGVVLFRYGAVTDEDMEELKDHPFEVLSIEKLTRKDGRITTTQKNIIRENNHVYKVRRAGPAGLD